MKRYKEVEPPSLQRRRFLGFSVAALTTTAALWGGLPRIREQSVLSRHEAAFYRSRQPG